MVIVVLRAYNARRLNLEIRMVESSASTSNHPPGAMNPGVDWYFAKHTRWEQEIRKLRTIALECELTEELKWGCPCYTLNGSNVVLIHVFKAYCALLFFKGAMLKDDHRILVQQTKNVQVARQIRFTNMPEVDEIKHVVRAYILQATEVEKSALPVKLKETAEFAMPEEFKKKLEELPALENAFYALTPGRQRGYLLHFTTAKQSKTRAARVQRCMARILDGKGLDD